MTLEGRNLCGVCRCKIVCLLYFLNSCRYELRVRYLPKSFHELYAKDKVTFYYLYDQVRIVFQDSKRESVFMIYLLIVCLFDLILYVPSTVFQLYRDRSSWVEPVLS